MVLSVISSVSAADLNSTNNLNNNLSISSTSSNSLTGSNSVYYVSPNGYGSGSSADSPTNWNNAYWQLNDGGTIYFTQGTYTNIVNQNINKNLTLSNYDNGKVILDASHNGYFFYCPGSSNSLTVNGLTFIGGTGYSGSDTYNQLYGGCIYSKGYLNLVNSKFMGNSAVTGACVYASNVSAIDCSFTGNTASYSSGAVYTSYGYFKNSNFTSNRVTVQEAGAVRCLNDGTFINCVFTGNSAPYLAGALYCKCATINSCSFVGNRLTSGGSGGAVVCDDGNILFSNFTGNGGSEYSGAVQCGGTLDVTSSTFMGNSASKFGGALGTTDGTIVGSIFIYNSAPKGNSISYSNSLSADYNWWGENNPFDENNNEIYYHFWDFSGNDIGYTITPNNWIILSGSTSKSSIKPEESIILTVNLNTCKTSSGSVINLPSNIGVPVRTVSYSCSEGNFSKYSQIFTKTVTNTYTPNNDVGLVNLTISMDKQVLTLPVTVAPDQPLSTSIINTFLNTTVNGTVIIYVTSPNNIVNTGSVNLFYNNKAISTAYVKNGEAVLSVAGLPLGNYTVNAFYFGKNLFSDDSKILNLTINALTVEDNSSYLIVNNFSEMYGAGKNFTGFLVDVNGNPIVGQHVNLYLHRVGSWNKTYWATTGLNGEFNLPINLAPGNFTILSSYYGDGKYLASNYSLNFINIGAVVKSPTTISLNPFVHAFGSGNNLTGRLINSKTGDPIVGQHVSLNLHRVGSWNKTYWVTTGLNGEFNLPINLSRGGYDVISSYSGTYLYNASMVKSTLTVYQK
jgi:hypothetical protein